MTAPQDEPRPAFTPALGVAALTPLYDAAIILLTREARWRRALLAAADLRSGQRLLDVGCGTGSLALLFARHAPGARIAGLDPDPQVLARAAAKLRRAGVSVALHQGFLTPEFLAARGPFEVIVSSLVLHQVPLPVKAEMLALMRRGLAPGGRLCVADYGLQRTALMRALFRHTVQRLDGVADTQPNADGVLPRLMAEAGFAAVAEAAVVPTATGSISIYIATP
jgi:ubiquinone/menaquinone biosynthesis C-methylase UbiE